LHDVTFQKTILLTTTAERTSNGSCMFCVARLMKSRKLR
jgi:hypothetical protein